MMSEASNTWAKCKFGYWYLGHLHHHIRKKNNQTISKDYNDITVIKDNINDHSDRIDVQYIRSVSGSDSWHHTKGYKPNPAMECFLHCPEQGQIARFTKYV